jgi:hypothetical protein
VGQGQAKLRPPAFAETVNLVPVTGTVLVKLATTGRFVPLSAARQVSVGTVVDASAGTVRLTAATPSSTQLAGGDFDQGIFEIRQDRAERGVTELRIRNRKTARASCGPGPGQAGTREFGSLLGDAHGQFRTRGDFAAATVRGTKWGVRNRCDGTLTIVRRGVMVVTDFRLHRRVTVRAGHSYLAKAR